MDHTTKLIQKGRLVEKKEKLEALRVKIDRAKKEIIYSMYVLDSEDPENIKDEHLVQAAMELQETLRKYRMMKQELREVELG